MPEEEEEEGEAASTATITYAADGRRAPARKIRVAGDTGVSGAAAGAVKRI